jgi:hypothetical protein
MEPVIDDFAWIDQRRHFALWFWEVSAPDPDFVELEKAMAGLLERDSVGLARLPA